jgi:hypothetical protein
MPLRGPDRALRCAGFMWPIGCVTAPGTLGRHLLPRPSLRTHIQNTTVVLDLQLTVSSGELL